MPARWFVVEQGCPKPWSDRKTILQLTAAKQVRWSPTERLREALHLSCRNINQTHGLCRHYRLQQYWFFCHLQAEKQAVITNTHMLTPHKVVMVLANNGEFTHPANMEQNQHSFDVVCPWQPDRVQCLLSVCSLLREISGSLVAKCSTMFKNWSLTCSYLSGWGFGNRQVVHITKTENKVNEWE